MPQQTAVATENSFTQGLRTEFTGLNFPENAVTATENCIFERIGNVRRRAGIDYETNYTLNTQDRDDFAVSTFMWKNAGGDGNTNVLVQQMGDVLLFYEATNATITSPLSSTLLPGTITMQPITGGSVDTSLECQYADGNGYLFVFHPSCDPFYVTLTKGSPSSVVGNAVDIKIRDVGGLPEIPFIDITNRPASLSATHSYNLQNQGWVGSTGGTPGTPGHPAWATSGTSGEVAGTGTKSFTLNGGAVPAIVGESVTVNIYTGANAFLGQMIGTVSSYGHPSLVLSISSSTYGGTLTGTNINFSSPGTSGSSGTPSTSYIDIFRGAASGSVYPSNADIWWTFKDSNGSFNPASTLNNVYLNSAWAPKGYYRMDAFDQDRQTLSGVSTISTISSDNRPRTGAWFQGRVFYAGVDFSIPAATNTPVATWTENIYFSQIVENTDQFGLCYQANDPTSPDTFDLLPTDGGVITIPGMGSVYKLFPVQNGLLVFAANGIWFVTGSQGIGFAANDYTVTKISGIQAVSGSTFVNVQGYPMWWNEEGIYAVSAGQNGLEVQPLTFTTIQSFYQDIPLTCKKSAKGEYDPLDWIVRWTFKSTEPETTLDKYNYDRILVYNLISQGWYVHTLPDPSVSGTPTINSIVYVQNPGGIGNPNPVIKYLTSKVVSGTSYHITFSEEQDETNWVDFHSSGTDYNYSSFFETGYKVHGQGQRRVQSNYIFFYLNNIEDTAYRHQGIWSYAIARDSNKYTTLERVDVTEDSTLFGVVTKRRRLRGRGLVYQFRIESVDGKPFDMIGWSIQEKINPGV